MQPVITDKNFEINYHEIDFKKKGIIYYYNELL